MKVFKHISAAVVSKIPARKINPILAVTAMMLVALVMLRVSLPVYFAAKGYVKEAATSENESEEKNNSEKQNDSKFNQEKEELFAHTVPSFSFGFVMHLLSPAFRAHQINYIPHYYATIHIPPPDFNAVITA